MEDGKTSRFLKGTGGSARTVQHDEDMRRQMRCRGQRNGRLDVPGAGERRRSGGEDGGDGEGEGKLLTGWSARKAGRGREQKSDGRKAKKKWKRTQWGEWWEAAPEETKDTHSSPRRSSRRNSSTVTAVVVSVKIRYALHVSHDWHDNPMTKVCCSVSVVYLG